MVCNGTFLKEKVYCKKPIFITEETSPNLVEEKLDEILSKDDYKEINVFSALNHFSLTPDTFAEHELGYKLISYNAPVNEENEELMLW